MIWEEPSRREECPVCQAESRARLEFRNTQGQKDMPELRWTVALRCMAEGKPPPEKEVGHSPASPTKCSFFHFLRTLYYMQALALLPMKKQLLG